MIYDFTFVNNVVFNWRHRTVDGGDHRSFYTILNNYFKPGPVTPLDAPVGHRLLKPESRRAKPPVDDYGKAYVAGNIVEGNEAVTANNWNGGVQIESIGESAEILAGIRAAQPYPHAYLDIEPAERAFETVLTQAGATLPKRDAVDERVVHMVRDGEIRYASGRGILTEISQVGGYPEYQGEPYTDEDADGMPDFWEREHGLNPGDATDAGGDSNGDGYTNIEDCINGTDPRAPAAKAPVPQSYIDLWNTDPDLGARLERR
jgi:hypothetical protein